MENRVILEKRGREPSVITELVLDNCRSTSITGVTNEFSNLEKLSMIGVGLTNLKGFPKLPNLKKLELSDNRISGGLNQVSSNCPKLKSLYLSANKIGTIEALEPLKDLSNLERLDLQHCEVTSVENYREKVYTLLPNLKFLDGFNQNDKEADNSDSENGKAGKWDFEDKDDSEEEESEEEGPGLNYLQRHSIDEESEGDDYSPEEEGSDVEIDSSEEEENPTRGEKRKLENDE